MSQLLNWLNLKNSIFIIVAIGFITYFSSLFNGYTYDDADFILGNPLIQSLSNLPVFFTYHHDSPFLSEFLRNQWGNFYRPISASYLALTFALSFGTPFLLNLTQILLHITNTCLLYALFNTFFQKKLSLVLALIFLVHPINFEAISHIGFSDLLYSCFGLLALNKLLYQKYNSWNRVYISVLFLFSLFSKETGLLFLIVSFLGIVLYKRESLKPFIQSSILVTVIYSFLRFVIAQPLTHKIDYNPILNSSILYRAITIPKIIFYYVSTIVYPHNLSIAQQWVVKKINFQDFYLPLLLDFIFFTVFITFLLLLPKKNVSQKQSLYFLFWFILGLVPHLQIIPLVTIVADRWFYFSFIGLLGTLGVIFQKIQLNQKIQRYLFFPYCVLILSFIVITNMRIMNWRNNVNLYEHDLLFQRNSYILLNNLGDEYVSQNKVDEAKKLFEQSVNADPNGWINWNNLANIYYKKGDTQKAKEYYQKAIKNGKYELSYLNLAILLLSSDSPQYARDFTKGALIKFSHNYKLWRILALAENKLDNNEEAIKDASHANSLYSDSFGIKLYNDLVTKSIQLTY